MSYIKKNSEINNAEAFTKYCIRHGFSRKNLELLTTDNVYDMLYVCWVERTSVKRLTRDAFEFEQNAGVELEERAERIAKLTWRPEGYKTFRVWHPERIISAPLYPDRIVEYWLTEQYLIPFWKDKLIPNNMACQKDKGPDKAQSLVKEALKKCYEKYGTNFWFFQGDMQAYYDNISQSYVKKIHEGMNPYGYFLLCNIIDSWEEPECYAKELNPNGRYGIFNPEGKFGFPKGNLPSQWVGITTLNELDHLLSEREDCLFYIRYMDDFIAFFHFKSSCKDCKNFTETYLQEKEIGVRLHPRKTAYAPISRGFNFCGWHYHLREDGSIEVKIRQDRKKLKKKQLKAKQKAYAKERISWDDVRNSMQSTFAHYAHGDTKRLRKYICNRYRFQRNNSTKQQKLMEDIYE